MANPTYEIISRIIDFTLSLVAVSFLMPVVLPLALLLRLTGEGEVFYLQERIGRKGKIFRVVKFATMVKDSPNIGHGAITVTDDPRVLPVGKFLRRSKINELPQLWNVLVGEMSFVGPRPLMPKQFEFYSEREREIIMSMRPGLTGAGSIVFRNEEKYFDSSSDPDKIYRDVIAPGKALLEIWYFKNKSIVLYFKLIVITAIAIFKSDEIYDGFLDSGTATELRNVLCKD